VIGMIGEKKLLMSQSSAFDKTPLKPKWNKILTDEDEI